MLALHALTHILVTVGGGTNSPYYVPIIGLLMKHAYSKSTIHEKFCFTFHCASCSHEQNYAIVCSNFLYQQPSAISHPSSSSPSSESLLWRRSSTSDDIRLYSSERETPWWYSADIIISTHIIGDNNRGTRCCEVKPSDNCFVLRFLERDRGTRSQACVPSSEKEKKCHS